MCGVFPHLTIQYGDRSWEHVVSKQSVEIHGWSTIIHKALLTILEEYEGVDRKRFIQDILHKLNCIDLTKQMMPMQRLVTFPVEKRNKPEPVLPQTYVPLPMAIIHRQHTTNALEKFCAWIRKITILWHFQN